MKAATVLLQSRLNGVRISIHAAREGGDAFLLRIGRLIKISIHAAREGGDVAAAGHRFAATISIHAAREGGDHSAMIIYCMSTYFNPRRP